MLHLGSLGQMVQLVPAGHCSIKSKVYKLNLNSTFYCPIQLQFSHVVNYVFFISVERHCSTNYLVHYTGLLFCKYSGKSSNKS